MLFEPSLTPVRGAFKGLNVKLSVRKNQCEMDSHENGISESKSCDRFVIRREWSRLYRDISVIIKIWRVLTFVDSKKFKILSFLSILRSFYSKICLKKNFQFLKKILHWFFTVRIIFITALEYAIAKIIFENKLWSFWSFSYLALV